jgi:hypothetical protein
MTGMSSVVLLSATSLATLDWRDTAPLTRSIVPKSAGRSVSRGPARKAPGALLVCGVGV